MTKAEHFEQSSPAAFRWAWARHAGAVYLVSRLWGEEDFCRIADEVKAAPDREKALADATSAAALRFSGPAFGAFIGEVMLADRDGQPVDLLPAPTWPDGFIGQAFIEGEPMPRQFPVYGADPLPETVTDAADRIRLAIVGRCWGCQEPLDELFDEVHVVRDSHGGSTSARRYFHQDCEPAAAYMRSAVEPCQQLVDDIEAVLAGETTKGERRRLDDKRIPRRRAPKPDRVTLRFL